MANPKLLPLDKPGIAPHTISTKLRAQLAYFASIPSEIDHIKLGEAEYFFEAGETAKTLDDGVLMLVSPLDTANMALPEPGAARSCGRVIRETWCLNSAGQRFTPGLRSSMPQETVTFTHRSKGSWPVRIRCDF